ncbi:hypothetical protein [Bacteriovorax sp. Seq25_V]|uniref:hypothetical protein n=1 Tax=Bacteriovorax sp. Seq25_V TaxID=1201288 RepID=UPI00038A3924|nr:hypothetical protein [Bacteriovorax sp. Seq25_V]EQC45548.1 hypothetical protein M900_1935 [Bacteriovorax sp. Seq25_V]
MKERRTNVFALIFSIVLSLGGLAEAKDVLSGCPNKALGETSEDCPWASISRFLDQVASEGKNLEDTLRAKAPALVEQIEIDSRNEVLKSLWGRALNFDQSAKGQIVSPAVVDILTKLSKTPKRDGIVVHAGIQHTYSYLFSNLKTAYGYKRARWVRPDVEVGFNLPLGTLLPNSVSESSGTLFANVTYFVGQFAYRGHASELLALQSSSKTVARSLLEMDFKKFEHTRLTEQAGNIEIQTDFIKFKKTVPGSTNSYLLVYSVSSPFYGNSKRLITAFPVDAKFMARMTESSNLGESKPIQSRYNAYIPELINNQVVGKRTVSIIQR